MEIHLPEGLESALRAQVEGGRFPSIDDAMAEAARRLLHDIDRNRPQPAPAAPAGVHDPLMGLFRDHPDEIDEIVADAMRWREEPWRDIDVE